MRLITLTGPGGVGKTRLALEIARGIATEAVIRVVFVPLAAIREPKFVAPAIGEALGLGNITLLDLPKRLRIACADRPTLLVLDNFEQVLDASPLVDNSCHRSPRYAAGHESRRAPRARGAR